MQPVPGEEELPDASKAKLAMVRKHAREYGGEGAATGAGHAEECEREVQQEKEAEREKETEVEWANQSPERELNWDYGNALVMASSRLVRTSPL